METNQQDEPTNRADERELPEVGTKVVHHQQFGEPMIGEVVPRDTWSHPDELTPESFVVEFDDLRARYTLEQASATEKVVHID